MAYEFADLGGGLFCGSIRLIKPSHCLFRAPSQFAFVDCQQPAVFKDKTAVDHDAFNSRPVLRVSHLQCGVSKWHVINMTQIKKYDVRFVTPLKFSDTVETQNVITDGFHANTHGDSFIHERIELPNPCVAPIVMILAGSEDKWFAVTGFESEKDGGD